MLSWRLCLQLGKPMIIAEDDAILAKKLKQNLEILLQDRGDLPPFSTPGMEPWTHFYRLNLNQDLGLSAYLNLPIQKKKELKQLVNCKTERRICKLKRCFGLPAYRITPETAKYLLKNSIHLSARQ